jgi:hypothetical protein
VLSVTPAGNGTGTITSSPAGISCGTDCSASFAPDTMVVLTASPTAGSNFVGWSGGDCTGTGTCTTTLTAPTAITATFATQCDSFTSSDGTTIPNWTEHVGDWVIDNQRMRINQAGGIYANNVTIDGSTQLDGCGRLTAIYGGSVTGNVVGVVLRWQSASNYIVALVQDNNGSGTFDSAWLYQMPLAAIGAPLVNQNFGTSPNIEACVNGATVTLRIDADQSGTYEAMTTGTTSISGAGLTGVMAKSDSATTTNMPLVDNACWGP